MRVNNIQETFVHEYKRKRKAMQPFLQYYSSNLQAILALVSLSNLCMSYVLCSLSWIREGLKSGFSRFSRLNLHELGDFIIVAMKK